MRLNNATIKQVIVSPVTLGERLRLCGIRPYNEYIDGNRTDTVLGYTYTVTCSGFQGERLDVKIPGKQLLGEDAYDHLVKFANIQLGIYNKLILGRGLMGDVIIDIDKTPHILIGGNTGSGKSVLVQCLLWQAIQQADVVYVADFKGGVDFSYVWQEFAYIITEEKKLLVLLNHLADILEERKRLFKEVDTHNHLAASV